MKEIKVQVNFSKKMSNGQFDRFSELVARNNVPARKQYWKDAGYESTVVGE